MHAMDLCHGDLTPSNMATRLARPLDLLEAGDLNRMLGEPRTEDVEHLFVETPSPAPRYLVDPIDLTLLPPDYLSTRICVLDFDHLYSCASPPQRLSGIPPQFLAPETIFELRYGPPADIWAFGCVLFRLRTSEDPFSTVECPSDAVQEMLGVLGELPVQWRTVRFDTATGHPIRGESDSGIEWHDFRDDGSGWMTLTPLEDMVDEILVPRTPESVETGLEKLALYLPRDVWLWGQENGEKDKFVAKHMRRIGKDDARLFSDLLRKIFDYDYQRRISARDILKHEWLRWVDGAALSFPHNAERSQS
ncbi:hypothetical protein VTK73DRAFT_9224 [Phialemonium thermophilum]|uniref:Protein kinase domain-containing protein n=1 Tax=Phialemonium thermophilum TaxID=223376 RepID=A0ABR3W3Q5_9PEZI